MGVEPSATLPQIAKAYRKRSLELHPDKNRGVKGVEERFARLGLINTILRNPELRDRYNVCDQLWDVLTPVLPQERRADLERTRVRLHPLEARTWSRAGLLGLPHCRIRVHCSSHEP